MLVAIVSESVALCQVKAFATCAIVNITSAVLLQTGVSHSFGSGGSPDCPASWAVESRGRGQRHQSLTDYSSASLC